MKGLLIKDFSVLMKQMRVFLALIFIFSIIPGSNMTIFAVVYAAMMPYTALAYDERSHWDQLAAMMPYTVRDLVLSKYVLGWVFTGGAAALALIAGAAERAFGLAGAAPMTTLLAFFAGVIMIALTLPLMFRFGVERGRMFFILLIVVVACGSVGLVSGLAESPETASLIPLLAAILPIAAVVLSAVSVALSLRFYVKRDR